MKIYQTQSRGPRDQEEGIHKSIDRECDYHETPYDNPHVQDTQRTTKIGKIGMMTTCVKEPFGETTFSLINTFRNGNFQQNNVIGRQLP